MEYRPPQRMTPDELDTAFVVLAHDPSSGWQVDGFVVDPRLQSSATALKRAVEQQPTLADRPVACLKLRRKDVVTARRDEPEVPPEPPPAKVRLEPLPARDA